MAWTRERWSRIEALFHDVAGRPEKERAAFLASHCGGDDQLRSEVERLLVADAADHDDLLDAGVTGAVGAVDPLVGRTFGSFRILERIGEGGMGAVYRAVRVGADFEQEVAIKILRAGLATPAMQERFARERQTLARLVHPNVARLLDGGTADDGVPWFAMELVDGVPVDRALDDRRATIRERLTLFASVCRAVQFAHQNLIVHLDLKPGNVLVDRTGSPKLVDFGIAGLLRDAGDSTIALTRSRPVTPEDASPEVLRGEPVSTASDVYSLGAVLYELLTGTRAFRRTRSDVELMRAVCETDASPPSASFTQRVVDVSTTPPGVRAAARATSAEELVRTLRGDLDRIVTKAMRKEPQRRYASCLELAEDVERHLGGFPVTARGAGFGYRAAKFVRRNALLVAAATVVLAALVVTVVVTTHMASVARKERDEASAAREREQVQAALARTERDAAAEARQRAEHDAGHARIEAQSHHLVAAFLGETFLSSRTLTDAERSRVLATVARKAAQTRRQHPDDVHLCANLIDALGRTCTTIGAFAEAETLLREAGEMRRREFGERSLEHAVSLASLSQLWYHQGKIAEARDAARTCLAIHRECPTDVHTDVARAANDLAAIERAAGNVTAARDLHREALELRRRGGDDLLIAESLNNLASAEADPRAARALFEEALARRTRVLGEGDPMTLQTAINLGSLLVQIGELEVGRDTLRSAVDRSRTLESAGTDGIAVAARALAYAEMKLGDHDAAAKVVAEGLEHDRARYGDRHARIAALLDVRASLEAARGDWPAAVATWRETLAIRRAVLAPGHRSIASTQQSLGAALVRLGDPEGAVAELRAAAATHEAARSPAGDQVDTTMMLGLAEEKCGRTADAERALLSAFDRCEGDPAARSRVSRIRMELRSFYVRQNRPDDAARFAEPVEAPPK